MPVLDLFDDESKARLHASKPKPQRLRSAFTNLTPAAEKEDGPLVLRESDRGIDVTPEGIEQLKQDESSGRNYLSVYKDPKGLRTIGHGFNLDAPDNKADFIKVTKLNAQQFEEVREGKRQITVEQQHALLEHEIAQAEGETKKLFPEYDQYAPAVQDVLTNLVFNMGLSVFGQFKNTIAAIKARDGDAAAARLLKSRYAKQVGPRAERIAEVLREQLVKGPVAP